MHLEEPMKHTRLYGKNTQNCVNYEAYTRVKYLERKQEEATFCSLIWWWCLPCCSVNCAYHRLQYKCHLKSFSSPFVFHSLSHLSDSKHTVKEINSCPYGFKTCCCNYAIEEFSWTFEYLYLSPPMITLMRRMRGHFVMLIPS